MKRLKKGFTLIELLVVIAIIGILATTLAPKLREQLAKAKDSKAIAVLGAGRTAAEVLFIDKLVQNDTTGSVTITLAEIKSKLDSKAQAVYSAVVTGVTTTSSALVIGGSGDGTKVTSYGGTIGLVAPTIDAASDSIEYKFEASAKNSAGAAGGAKSSEGKDWDEY